MGIPLRICSVALLSLLRFQVSFAQTSPDQFYELRIDSLVQSVDSSDGVVLSADGKRLVLDSGRIDGSVILKPQSAQYPFDQALPSWNGWAPDSNSSFKVQMRFPFSGGWSPWLTVGYWNSSIWSSYGTTSYGGGFIDYDNAKLSSPVSSWQFKILLTRATLEEPSPSIHRLSLFVSDSRTTTSFDFNQVLGDKPDAIFVATDFIYQYAVDPVIGGSICSPTTVSMILRSYGIPVDPLQFARDTHDPYFDMFGIWPRVVQNASEYGLDGAVTRYRTWSQAREILAGGGRVAMSVGPPLYSGHLMMLAGFTANGDPLVHDPARSNGYSYLFSKSDLSHSWFDKGGVAYTFFQAEPGVESVGPHLTRGDLPLGFHLDQNFPNPFNPTTVIRYHVPRTSVVKLAVYDLLGREVSVLANERKDAGTYQVRFDASGLSSGVYYCRLQSGGFVESRQILLLK